MQRNSEIAARDEVLCVFRDATFELRGIARRERRESAHGLVSVPELEDNEHALWLSCDFGLDRWYIYRGSLMKTFEPLLRG